ncbi:MAG: hypothetical protein JXA00_06065 [Candidatus Thermoplasmatota archaeon]|nr:hypothetical protein [Candidatus Thermoplasmatota archaeon]
MKKKILMIVACVLLLTVGTVAGAATQAGGIHKENGQAVPVDGNGNGLLLRLRNRVCDMLGICQGGCNLTELTGIFVYDQVNFFIDDVELHFGPQWYITSAVAAEDYDGDGDNELIIDELVGLVGAEVTVEGHLQSEGWMSVFTINGMVYREPGQPIWAAEHHWRWKHGQQP